MKSFAERFGKNLIRPLSALLTGILTGLLVSALSHAVSFVTALRLRFPLLVYLMPAGGLLIVFLYGILKDAEDKGTNLVLLSIRQGDYLPLHKIPENFISNVLSHLFGASVGRLGSALQMGGCLGFHTGRLLKQDPQEYRILTMCGMSSAFSALFGTPLAGALFGLEAASVGRIYYPALMPCFLSSVSALLTARALGLRPLDFGLVQLPSLSVSSLLITFLAGLLAALVSVVFCLMLQYSGMLHRRYAKNPYLRIFAGGLLFTLLYALLGTEKAFGDLYRGGGLDVISSALVGQTPALSFLMKMLFTAIAVGAGFKGGEIAAVMMSGACFGAALSFFLPLPVSLLAAVGLTTLFAGMTNCPISALLFALSLFGTEGAPYWLIASATGYAFSGRYSLYAAQELLDPK